METTWFIMLCKIEYSLIAYFSIFWILCRLIAKAEIDMLEKNYLGVGTWQ